MAIETFTREQFEKALPADNKTGLPLCNSLGLREGEFAYTLRVTPDVAIMIRSSVRADGVSAECGEDSIRLWLMDSMERPIMKKLTRWVTRVPGWQKRLTDQARALYKVGKLLKRCGCGADVPRIRRCKQGTNEGRYFLKCDQCGKFEWFDLQNIIPAK